MIQHSRLRRIGWIAALAICTALYLLLHLRVNAVRSEVIRAERQIVQLEHQKLLLETEFATRANQLQLARWNRVEFGYSAPAASQFIDSERQLAAFSGPRSAGAPAPIRVAGFGTGEEAPSFPKLVSPLTGKPMDPRLLDTAAHGHAESRSDGGVMRIPLAALAGGADQ